jgi:hypothetical protein
MAFQTIELEPDAKTTPCNLDSLRDVPFELVETSEERCPAPFDDVPAKGKLAGHGSRRAAVALLLSGGYAMAP